MEGDESGVLLDRKPGLAGEIFRRDEGARDVHRVPIGRARAVDQRFVDALATLRRDAAIAELEGTRKRVVARVCLVDDEGEALAEIAKRQIEGQLARQRLLDIKKMLRDGLERLVIEQRIDERRQRFRRRILLVGVEREPVIDAKLSERLRRSSPDARDPLWDRRRA